MIRKYFLLIVFLLGTVAGSFSQGIKEEVVEFRPRPKQFTDNLQVVEIYTITKKEIRKYNKEVIKRCKKRAKEKKIPWITPKPKKTIESYVIILEDSTKYPYRVVSEKVETISEKRIMIGEKYEFELNMIRDAGNVHGLEIRSNSLSGKIFPLPREAWISDIYTTPNLEGLYYVK